jgi:hypothetical protein
VESPASPRLQLMVALGCVWHGCRIVQSLPTLLLIRSFRVMGSDPEMRQALKENGHSPDLLLTACDVSVISGGFEIAVRLAVLAVLGWAMSGHRSARWMAVIGIALVLGNNWHWDEDWWVWLVDLGLAGGLLWVLWTPEPRTRSRRHRDILPRVVVIPSQTADRF